MSPASLLLDFHTHLLNLLHTIVSFGPSPRLEQEGCCVLGQSRIGRARTGKSPSRFL